MFKYIEKLFGCLKVRPRSSINLALLPTPPEPIYTNFDFGALCPAGTSSESYESWIALYLQQLPPNTLLLWSDDEHKLNLSFSHNNQVQHACFQNFTVNQQSKKINAHGQGFATISAFNDVLTSLGHQQLPNMAHLPTQDELLNKKFLVYLAKKVVTDEMVNHVTQSTTRLLDNFDQCSTCTICLEKYTNNNPAVLLIKTGQVYHEPCLQTYFITQHAQGQALTCPLTTTLVSLQGVPFDIKNLTTPDLSYKAALNDSNELFTYMKHMQDMLKIEREKIKRLETELQQKNQPEINQVDQIHVCPAAPSLVVFKKNAI